MKTIIFLLLLQISLLYCKFYLVKLGKGRKHHREKIHHHKKHRKHHKRAHKAEVETITQNPFLIAGKFEGDMDMGSEERESNVPKRKNGVLADYRWPNGKIPYTLKGNFLDNETALIMQVLFTRQIYLLKIF